MLCETERKLPAVGDSVRWFDVNLGWRFGKAVKVNSPGVWGTVDVHFHQTRHLDGYRWTVLPAENKTIVALYLDVVQD